MKCKIDETDGEVRFYLQSETPQDVLDMQALLPKIKKPSRVIGNLSISNGQLHSWAWVSIPRRMVGNYDMTRFKNEKI